MKKIILLLSLIFIAPLNFAQETTIQFPRLNFHLEMNQNLRPTISYDMQADIVVGDKSGLIFTLGANGDGLNLQSGINDLLNLNTLKFTIVPSVNFNFHTFYGRYKYIGEDKVLTRAAQFYYTPNADYYGYSEINGAGIATTFPVEDGRYEPELSLYSSNFNGIDFLNADFMTTFRFETWYMEIYAGLAVPTIGAVDSTVRARGGMSFYTSIDYFNMYFAFFVPAHYGTRFTIDDMYFRISQHLLINGFEQTFSIYSLGAESGNTADPLVGFNNIPDLNIYLSIGGRHQNIGYGFDYGYIYGLYQSELNVNNTSHNSNRLGAYIDFTFLTLVYKFGLFYTLPDSAAYIKSTSGPGDLGLYISVFGST